MSYMLSFRSELLPANSRVRIPRFYVFSSLLLACLILLFVSVTQARVMQEEDPKLRKCLYKDGPVGQSVEWVFFCLFVCFLRWDLSL